MINFRPLVLAMLLSACAQVPLLAQAAPPLVVLALTINDGTSPVAYRGWPLLLRGDFVLMEDAAAAIALDDASMALAITSTQGAVQSWPVQRVSKASEVSLRMAGDGVRVMWLLPGAQTATLAAGSYSARISLRGRTSPAIAFTLQDAAATLSAEEETRRAILQSEAARLLEDAAGALTALEPAQARQPDSIELLLQRARVHLGRGEPGEALQATQRALKIFHREDPRASHPPLSILEVESDARAELFKDAARDAPIVDPLRPRPRTASTPVPPISQKASMSPPPGASSVAAAATPTSPSPASITVVRPTSAGPATAKVVLSAELVDATIRADTAGQWAAAAQAKSSYSNPNYGPAKATGEPNVGVAGDSIEAWCPGQQNTGIDWLEVTFAKPTRAVEVRVRQNHTPGSIVKVEAIEANGLAHVWWEGADPNPPPAIRGIMWFAVRVPPTAYAVAKVRITLNLSAVSGWKQIDAVQLVAAP